MARPSSHPSNRRLAPVQPAAGDLTIEVDLDGLTIEELEDFEDATGTLFAHIAAAPSVRAIRGLIWIVRRRSEPDLEFDDLRGMTVPELKAWGDRLTDLMAGAAPLGAGGPAASTPPARSSKPSRTS